MESLLSYLTFPGNHKKPFVYHFGQKQRAQKILGKEKSAKKEKWLAFYMRKYVLENHLLNAIDWQGLAKNYQVGHMEQKKTKN